MFVSWFQSFGYRYAASGPSSAYSWLQDMRPRLLIETLRVSMRCWKWGLDQWDLQRFHQEMCTALGCSWGNRKKQARLSCAVFHLSTSTSLTLDFEDGSGKNWSCYILLYYRISILLGQPLWISTCFLSFFTNTGLRAGRKCKRHGQESAKQSSSFTNPPVYDHDLFISAAELPWYLDPWNSSISVRHMENYRPELKTQALTEQAKGQDECRWIMLDLAWAGLLHPSPFFCSILEVQSWLGVG